jgi:hypothetical protein
MLTYSVLTQQSLPKEKSAKKRKIVMQYKNYDREIKLCYKVQIVGWPPGVKFMKPSAIGSVEDLRILHDALLCGECHWVPVPPAELEALKKTLEAAGKERRTRKDTGVIRGPQGKRARRDNGNEGSEDGSGNEEETRPRKRAKKTSKKGSRSAAKMLPPRPKSREYVETDDDESGEDGVDNRDIAPLQS